MEVISSLTVYADVVFVQNMVINFFILKAMLIISRTKANNKNVIISAMIGAIYLLVLLIYPQFNIFATNISKLIISIVMVQSVFFPVFDFRILMKNLLIFYLVSFVLAGVTLFLIYFLGGYNVLENGIIYIGKYPAYILVISVIISFLIFKYGLYTIKQNIKKEEIIKTLIISYMGKKAKIRAMIDTGNLLIDPITKHKVIVAQFESVKYLLPREMQVAFEKGDDIFSIISKQNDLDFRIRLIPFCSVGETNGLMIAFMPDCVEIVEDKKMYRDIFIGIYQNEISKTGEYSALIGL